MKKLICTLSLATFVAIGLAASIMAGEAKSSGTPSASVKVAEQTQKYVCSMHPDVVYDKPGKCPKCGMTLIPLKDGSKSKI